MARNAHCKSCSGFTFVTTAKDDRHRGHTTEHPIKSLVNDY